MATWRKASRSHSSSRSKAQASSVEANVQPANHWSLALVERLGFEREGYSRRYVKIGGRWRDHVRFSMLTEEWKKRRAELRRSLATAEAS
jgi:hypothetical protein